MNITNAELLEIINGNIVDNHIQTDCLDFIEVCYNLFYNTTADDVTFHIGYTEYTIPNLAKNTSVVPLEGTTDPEGNQTGAFGQFYYDSTNNKLYFNNTNDNDAYGWVLLYTYVVSLTEEEVLDNVTQLLINTQNIVETYYDMFYNTTPMDITLQLYDNEGVLQTVTVPNRAKAVVTGLSGTVDPENNVEATLGKIYVNTTSNTVFIKTTNIGTTGWNEIYPDSIITTHNNSATAHNGYLARVDGDSTQVFSVANPSAPSHAVNISYVGALTDLNTEDKSSLVNAINEVQARADQLDSAIGSVSLGPTWSINKGYVDGEGNADLILDLGAPYYEEDRTPEVYTDNTNNGRWGSNFGDSQNYWTWGNSGAPFGAPLGSGFVGYAIRNGQPNGPISPNVGYSGNPIVHTFEPALGPGIYKFACASNGYGYTLSAVYDGAEHPITLPPNLSSTEWSYTDTFTVTTSLTQIKAQSTGYQYYWGIGPIHLIQYIENSDFENKLYFKVGADYGDIVCSDINGKSFTKSVLSPISMSGLDDDTYNIFVPKTGDVYINNAKIYRQKNEPTHYIANYVVSGSPTISNYVMSDLAGSACIVLPQNFSTGSSSWEYIISHTTSSTIVGTRQALTGNSLGDGALFPKFNVISGKYVIYLSSDNSNWNIANGATGTYTMLPNSPEKVRFGWDTAKYYVDAWRAQWADITPSTTEDWSAIAYGAGKFVIIAQNTRNMLYSANGTTWNLSLLPSAKQWVDLLYDGNRFIALASDGYVAQSMDGVDWTLSHTELCDYQDWAKMAYGDGKYVVFSSANGGKKAYSTDGINWTISDSTTGFTASPSSVRYCDNKFIVIPANSTNSYLYSTDGITWSSGTLPTLGSGNYVDIVYGNGKYIVISDTATSNQFYYSEDGLTDWTAFTPMATAGWQNIVYGDNRFIATSYTSNTITRARSLDGITWVSDGTQSYSGTYSNLLCCGDEIFISPYTNNKIATYIKSWINDITVNSTTAVYQPMAPSAIGNDLSNSNNPYLGSIDLKECSLKVNEKPFWDILSLRENDIWMNTSVMPITVGKWTGNEWVPFTDVPLGKAVISGGIITSTETFQYNNRAVTAPNSTLPAYVIDAFRQGDSWYRKWSNGYIEQGGLLASAGTITFLVPFTTNNYCMSAVCLSSGTSNYSNKTQTSIYLSGSNVLWRACGY